MINRWLLALLLAVPATFVAEILHASPVTIFVLAALGLIPLAGLIGSATEALAEHFGHNIGGLLNATFGNAAEIIIGLAALTANQPEVVRASLAGSIIGNVLLVLGMSMFLGGWRHRRQNFSARIASEYATLLGLAVVGLTIPSLLATVGEGSRPGTAVIQGSALHQVSIGISIVLLFCYTAYIAYSVFGLRAAPVAPLREPEQVPLLPIDLPERTSSHLLMRLWRTTLWLPLLMLAVATVITALLSEVLVGTIEPLTRQVGLNPFFVGLIILPIVGNAAEHSSAVTSAINGQIEISLAITAGSSIQIALLAAPLLVLAGTIIGVPLDLNFSLLEVALFALLAGLYTLISLDGESNWLEGLLLLAFYIILAVGTFVNPQFV
ncbi:calcium/proton exchanger [Tengunoibacter tsumagoiensis]|uniref:Ca(2+)/H(+) antiporter n=1 Tax=Tengunoibacter tsumagoiensis TaxID=2014871 RepID=A0A401ZUZ9_9CHLR|nr:calcium/proton exchanger [Tengunoibacter tsumagoiensis]GCE10616.1 calcium/proton exchanger [Tengunoibacter tsumagoiensis]